MLDLRAGNIPALTRAAHLRELFGDPEGAIELLQMAHQQLGETETENRAWVLVQLSHLCLMQGKLDDADRMANQALRSFPDYHYALGQLSKVRRAQKRYNEAATLEQKRFEAAPHAENQFALAQTLELAGQKENARIAFADFERRARAEMNGADNANHELVFYYADHARKPLEAVKVAQSEIARRQDVHTLHAYAWALHKAGNHAEARKQIDRALSVGIRDPEFYRHAAQIALALNDRSGAKSFEQKAAELMPPADTMASARTRRSRVQ
jgi:tetratricopeptide (TPR) repeat protein